MCNNQVDQYSERGFHTVKTTHRCGTTSVDGGTLLCGEYGCDNTNGNGQAWYICRHGNDVSEHMCGACEFE